MKDFDYIIIGGGCAGLSLAYELEISDKLKNKSLAIIEPRDEYKRDKTWSFWKVFPHNFDDCVKKSWDNFSINIPNDTKFIDCKLTPYQSIDTGKFYDKILSKLKLNENIKFFKNINDIELSNSIIFNSVPNFDQKNEVHFFYTLPFSKKSALVETTWISNLSNENIKDYDNQIDQYLKNHLNIRNYKINFKEEGSIPLFRNKNLKKLNEIYIGSAGDMTRLSTGYTFLNIQEHSKYIAENIDNISKAKLFKIKKKYDFLDNIFLKVLRNNSSDMGEIFFKMFNSSPKTAINFLSNKSNFFEDLEIILKMPKWKFLKELF